MWNSFLVLPETAPIKDLKVHPPRRKKPNSIPSTEMKTPKAKRMEKLRSSTVEPGIGTLANYLAIKRVNTRGLQQANKCMLMAAVAYNLKKTTQLPEQQRRKYNKSNGTKGKKLGKRPIKIHFANMVVYTKAGLQNINRILLLPIAQIQPGATSKTTRFFQNLVVHQPPILAAVFLFIKLTF